jgi:hypothetical protein
MYKYKYKYKYHIPIDQGRIQVKEKSIGTHWGVDSSAAATTKDFYSSIVDKFGKTPKFWGRYLTKVPNRPWVDGLTIHEVHFLHRKGTKILPIYNKFGGGDTRTYDQGKKIAHGAIQSAGVLGVPKGTYLFANVEHGFIVTEEWIRGWADAFASSKYKPGIYHDPSRGNFSEAYCEATKKMNKSMLTQLVLWSRYPQPATDNPTYLPDSFKPSSPAGCKSRVWAWQYGVDIKLREGLPEVDVDMVNNRLFKSLW